MAGPNSHHETRLMALSKERGIIRARDLEGIDVPRVYLKRLVDDGRLIQLDRGLYADPDYAPPSEGSIAEVIRRRPDAVVCLLTALRLHELTTQNPFEVWIMIDRTARKPAIKYPPIRVIRGSGDALTEGIEILSVDGINVQVTNPAKAVADCFKHRSKIGIDVAVEALRDAWQKKKATMDELHRYAKIDRVARVIQPYLESLI